MDTSTLPKGQSRERTDGRPVNLPGIYRHTPTKNEFITSEGEEGVVMADALMNPLWHGEWKRVGDVPSRVELLAMREAQLKKDTPAKTGVKKG